MTEMWRRQMAAKTLVEMYKEDGERVPLDVQRIADGNPPLEETTILLVVLEALNPAQEKYLVRRFGRFWSPEHGHIEYPVSCDTHGFDVFRDEFGPGTIFENSVAHAALNALPFGPDSFEPFSEYSEGWRIAERNEEGTAWVFESWAEQPSSQ